LTLAFLATAAALNLPEHLSGKVIALPTLGFVKASTNNTQRTLL